MRLPVFLLLLAAAAPAGAAVTVIGNTDARLCYEAAESGDAGSATIARCDSALKQEGLAVADEVATYVNRGILKLRLGRLDDAVADFDAATARDAGEPEAYVNKGMAMLKSEGRWRDAVALFDEGLRRRTRRPEVAYFGRAAANELGGNMKQAYLDYRQASQLAPTWRDPQVELARFTVQAR
jgi:tetratricopeptide (TPR) repeat protein